MASSFDQYKALFSHSSQLERLRQKRHDKPPTYRYNLYEDLTNTMTGTGAVNTSGPSANLDSLLSGRNIRWYKGRQAVLTAMIALVLLTSMTNGYDG